MNSKERQHSLEFTFILCKAREVQISEFLTACLLFFPPVKCVHVQGKPFHSMCVFNEINTHFQCKVADV